MSTDHYQLTYDECINALSFRDNEKIFFFEIGELYKKLIRLKGIICKQDLCNFDLMEWPGQLFGLPPLNTKPESSQWFYKIVETWALEYNLSKHNNHKTEQFKIFLNECKEFIKLSHRPEQVLIDKLINSDNQYKELFSLEFIALLMYYTLNLSMDTSVNLNFINGLALLPKFYESRDKKLKKEIIALISPSIDLLNKNLDRGKEFDTQVNPKLLPETGFFFLGITIAITRKNFKAHVHNLLNTGFELDKKNRIIKQWVRYKQANGNMNNLNGSVKSKFKNVNRLSQKEIALYYCLTGQVISNENSDSVAKKYGFTAKYSGKKLCDVYNFFIRRDNRLGRNEEFSRHKLNKRIKLYEKVIEMLEEPFKTQAQDELILLEMNV